MRVAIGSDHAGYKFKDSIKKHLREKDIEVLDFGPNNDEASDYPDYAKIVAEKVIQDPECDLGILICGTGIGMSISANKIKGIRAALISTKFTAQSAKAHNHANVITFGSRVNTIQEVLDFIDIFLETENSQEPRHIKRVEKMGQLESKL
ncbi:MAG: ribose 5-phosphate isomerase B [Candidatus Izimaplasma sp.]|nr:ribose 5-phosphate isomerase B [Candidatus Izimaplasma bacterium]